MAATAVVCSFLTLAPSVMAAPRADGSDFSCRASAVRANLAANVPPLLEPVVANAPNAPCVADSAAILVPTTIGPVTVDAANAETVQTPADLAAAPAANGDNATATASVTNPAINLTGLTISATVLSARASYTCQNGQPVPAGSSIVTNLIINGMAIAIPANNAPLTLDLGPLGMLNLNQTIQEPNRITQRALNLVVPSPPTAPLVEVVIGEAIADFTGNPCVLGAAKPQCSDAVDNDGDGRIDAQDPGCLSGPGGAFNPNDNDERNNRAQCSDGIDNDRDGRVDTRDGGCSSASDTSERTPSGQSRLTTRPSGIARLGLRGPCTRRSFSARVTGRSIQRVVFSLDGRRIRSDGSSPFTTRVSTGRSGTHRVTARVTFRSDSRTRARTLRFGFRRCAAAVRFTG